MVVSFDRRRQGFVAAPACRSGRRPIAERRHPRADAPLHGPRRRLHDRGQESLGAEAHGGRSLHGWPRVPGRRRRACASAERRSWHEYRYPGRLSILAGSSLPCSDGWGGESLLESYDSERRPASARAAEVSLKNYRRLVSAAQRAEINSPTPEGDAARRMIGERLVEENEKTWHPVGVHLGYIYHPSPVVVPDGSPQAGGRHLRLSTDGVSRRAGAACLARARRSRSSICLAMALCF